MRVGEIEGRRGGEGRGLGLGFFGGQAAFELVEGGEKAIGKGEGLHWWEDGPV